MKKSLNLFLTVIMVFCSCCCICAAKAENGVAPQQEGRYAAATPYGGMIQDYVTDTVYYTRKEDNEKYTNPYEVPVYIASNIENACAITAGGSVIGYFDRLYEELIPNHTGIIFMGHFAYGKYDDAVAEMHQELYRRMGSTSKGTTVEGYVTGMRSYIESKGRGAEITSIYSKSSLNKSAYMTALEQGKLLTIFLDGFAIITGNGIQKHDGYDTIDHTIVVGLHTVTAYGYRNIRYYDANDNLIQEDNYLMVNTGFASAGLAMFRINKYTTVDDGYIINVS